MTTTSTTRILIIRFSSIGDIVLTTPVVRMLKQQLEGEVEIHFLTKTKFAGLLSSNPYVSKVHGIEKSVQEILPTLEQIGFDYIIDLHNNIRSSIVKRRLKSLSFTFDKLNVKKWIWVNFGINKMPDKHIVERYLETTKAFGIKDDGNGLDYFIPEDVVIKNEELNSFMRKPFIAFAIGGVHIGKRMSKEKLASLCADLPFPVVLLGGKEDADTGKFIHESNNNHVFDATGILSLDESALCVKAASLVITGDTGLMHIASAFKKKIISLWGCTVPGFGMYPFRPDRDSIIIEPAGRNKRPCSKLGNKCKYGVDNRCIDHISNEKIAEAVNRLMFT